jgi:hypothetical protein
MADDDYFASLGGSLMKDLLADLQVDENDWSLEQLEKELKSLDLEPSGPSFMLQQPLGFPSLDAASLVVTHAQERSAGEILPSAPSSAPPPGMGGVDVGSMDAWTLSLQKFTSLALQEDFLAADSARKQNQKRDPLLEAALLALDGAEDYDIKEKPTIPPPPGLGGGTPLASTVVAPFPAIPKKEGFPKTPQNSVSIAAGDPTASRDPSVATIQFPGSLASNPLDREPVDVVPLPVPAAEGPTDDPELYPIQADDRVPVTVAPPQDQQLPPPMGVPAPQMPPLHQGLMPPPPHGMVPMQFMPSPGYPVGLPPPNGMVPPMAIPMPMPPGASVVVPTTPPGAAVFVGAAVPSRGPAWQSPPPAVAMIPQQAPPQQQYPRPMRIFCNPHPNAPPIPAAALETSLMSARDIAYVIHSIMKPVLSEGVAEDDYYIEFLKRRVGGPQADPINPKRIRDMNQEMTSRESKSKEWASEKSTLGHVTRSNVARPRALIATPQATTADQDTEQQKHRANLWRARIYCDQAYQSYQKIVDIWRMAPPGEFPPQGQLHLVKLMKCMGIVFDSDKKVYSVDKESLKLLSKLGKGRTLIARVLEQALLPPNAVQTLLPALLDVAIPLPTDVGANPTGAQQQHPVLDVTVDRLFRGITGILLKLNVSGETLVQCLEVVHGHGRASLSSPAKMECIHALLQRGSMVVGQDASEETKVAWGSAETQFMSLIQTI